MGSEEQLGDTCFAHQRGSQCGALAESTYQSLTFDRQINRKGVDKRGKAGTVPIVCPPIDDELLEGSASTHPPTAKRLPQVTSQTEHVSLNTGKGCTTRGAAESWYDEPRAARLGQALAGCWAGLGPAQDWRSGWRRNTFWRRLGAKWATMEQLVPLEQRLMPGNLASRRDFGGHGPWLCGL